MYAAFGELPLRDLPYLAAVHLRQAEIHHRLGAEVRANEHYARFVELWRDPDPALRPQVAAARRRMAAPPR